LTSASLGLLPPSKTASGLSVTRRGHHLRAAVEQPAMAAAVALIGEGVLCAALPFYSGFVDRHDVAFSDFRLELNAAVVIAALVF